MGALASSVAHEFNNILTTIINYAKLGLRHPGDDGTRTQALEKILKGSQHAATIIYCDACALHANALDAEREKISAVVYERMIKGRERSGVDYANALRLKFHTREGSFAPWWKIIEIVVYDWPSAHAEAKVSGSAYPVKTTYDAAHHALHVTLADQAAEAELTIRGRASR